MYGADAVVSYCRANVRVGLAEPRPSTETASDRRTRVELVLSALQADCSDQSVTILQPIGVDFGGKQPGHVPPILEKRPCIHHCH